MFIICDQMATLKLLISSSSTVTTELYLLCSGVISNTERKKFGSQKTNDFFLDNLSWLPHFNDYFGIWKNIFNPIWATGELNRPQKGLNMVLNVKFYQPYSQYPVRALAYVRSRPSLVSLNSTKFPETMMKNVDGF